MFRNTCAPDPGPLWAPGNESPVHPWEKHLGGWTLVHKSRKLDEKTGQYASVACKLGEGAFGSVYACARGSETAACKVVALTRTDADDMRAEISRQRTCARFAPAVFHAHVEPPYGIVVMERFPLCVEDLLAGMFRRARPFMRDLAALLPSLLEQIDGFVAPAPGLQLMHGDLSIRNVLLRFYDGCGLEHALLAPRLPAFRLVACDFGYATLYASGLACDPVLARSELRRSTVFLPGYDRAFFLSTLVGAVARWAGRTCDSVSRELCKLEASLIPALKETYKMAKSYGEEWKWQEHAVWARDFLDERGITCAPGRGQ